MILINSKWNEFRNKFTREYLADKDSDITAGFDPECSEGSTIISIASASVFMKNTEGKWQKVGTTEVI